MAGSIPAGCSKLSTSHIFFRQFGQDLDLGVFLGTLIQLTIFDPFLVDLRAPSSPGQFNLCIR
ncbi:hypothetical protein LCGC14_1615890 [marine sediment metagenome]|uniref:Uncharacterized protein n=1 Tax=marine sediment metagenome TaxID=412755 RepID=A0A0F9ITR6_9ZZZZ